MRLSSPIPNQRGQVQTGKRRFSPWLLVPLILVLVLAAVGIWQMNANRSATATVTTVAVTRGAIVATVSGSGSIQPARAVDLPFQVAGQVTDLLVHIGDRVTAGQPLAKIDARQLELQAQEAEASLRSAQARLDQAKGKGATEQDIAQAKLNLQAAQLKLTQTQTGNTTAPDLKSAQANLQSAQAKLQVLLNPSAADVSSAETRVNQAQAQLQNTRDSDSAAKNRAELDLQQSTNSLTQAQAKYATAKQNWEYVQDSGNDPIQPDKTGTNGKATPNKLTDGQRQQYYDNFIQAEAALHSAEAALAQSQISYDTARQKEATDVGQATQTLQDAQIQLEALKHPTTAAITQARAAVTQAQSQLDKLRLGGTTSDIEAAQIQVDQAKLALDKLTAPSSDADLASAEASVIQAQAQLASAKLDLEWATLSAPFDGVITSVSAVVGGNIAASTNAISLSDPEDLHIDMNLSETDAARVEPNQPVTLTFDALPNQTLAGTVELVAPSATVQQNVVTYIVRVKFKPGNAKVKLGMSATGVVQIDRHDNAITVPSRALQSLAGRQFVQVQAAPGQAPIQVQVETGLSANGQIEIVSCTDTGNLCLREGDTLVVANSSAANNANRQRTGGFGGPVAIPFGR